MAELLFPTLALEPSPVPPLESSEGTSNDRFPYPLRPNPFLAPTKSAAAAAARQVVQQLEASVVEQDSLSPMDTPLPLPDSVTRVSPVAKGPVVTIE